MKYTILKIAVSILRIIYIPLKILPLQNKISIFSRQSDKPSLDITLIDEYLRENYPDIKVVVMTKKLKPTPIGAISYMFHMLHQMYEIATSRVVLVDGYCIAVCLLKHKEETEVIQMWHALGAIKKFGLQSIGTEAGADQRLADAMHMHENYDHVLCSSKSTAGFFSEGFNTPMKKMRFLGLPRIDSILNERKEITEKISAKYGSNDGKQTALYVPTFRKGETIDIGEIAEHIDFDKTRFIVKLHPLDETVVDDQLKKKVIVDTEFSTYDLLHYADVIITDYSSLGVEASLLKKPLLFYVYDYDRYNDNPGINIPLFEEMGSYATKDAAQLGKLMYEEYDYDRLEAFKNKYIEVDCENCTGKVCDFMVSLVKKEK